MLGIAVKYQTMETEMWRER